MDARPSAAHRHRHSDGVLQRHGLQGVDDGPPHRGAGVGADVGARQRSGSQHAPLPAGGGGVCFPPTMSVAMGQQQQSMGGGRAGGTGAAHGSLSASFGPGGLPHRHGDALGGTAPRRPLLASQAARPGAAAPAGAHGGGGAAAATPQRRRPGAAQRSSTALPAPSHNLPTHHSQPQQDRPMPVPRAADPAPQDRLPPQPQQPRGGSGGGSAAAAAAGGAGGGGSAGRVPAPPPLPNPSSSAAANNTTAHTGRGGSGGALPSAGASNPPPAPQQPPQPSQPLSRRASCPAAVAAATAAGAAASAPQMQGAAPLALRRHSTDAPHARDGDRGREGSAKGRRPPPPPPPDDAAPAPARPGSAAGGEALKRSFECAVCLELMCHPVCAPCGHHFCRACLDGALQRTKRCPTCRAPCHIDAQTHPESTLAAEAIQVLWPDAYAQRCAAAPLAPRSRGVVLPVVVRAEVAFPGQPVRVRLLDSRYRTQLLRRLLGGAAGRFLLLPAPATPAALPAKGAVGVCCRVDDCSPRRGHVVATAVERMRVTAAWQEQPQGQAQQVQDGDGLCYARCDAVGDSDESATAALAAAWRLRRRLSAFFDDQHPLLKGHVVADAGEEPPLPPLPPDARADDDVPRGATRYSFWAASVLGVFGILPDGARRGVLTEQLCSRRAALLQAGTRHLPTRRTEPPAAAQRAEGAGGTPPTEPPAPAP